MSDLTVTDDTISVDVTVTNTGETAGKDVVELYYTPPYTNGGIEKASVNLAAFDKTDLLEPGASQTLTLTFRIEDMASYDYQNAQAYVLEAGDYEISLRTASHTVVDTRTYTVDETVTYDGDNSRSTDLITATNQFDFAEGEIEYLSRADGFANYEEATAAPATYSMPEDDKALFTNNSNWEPEEDPDAQMPATGADNGLTLVDMRGLAYDDEQWEPLLDQLTIDEMNTMIALGGYQTAAAESIGKVTTTDCDGPASINNNFTGVGSIGFPCGVKHFALNDQETNRWEMFTTWSNEQAIRELYLKPFEICVKEGNAQAVMSSYDYIGSQWAGACSPLLETVLRDEWGFEGFVVTDYFANFGYMDATRSIYNGGSNCLAAYDTGSNYVSGLTDASVSDTSSATTVQHMREACHRICYTVVNSRAYEPENIQTGPLMYQIVLAAADIVIAVLIILYEAFRVRSVYKKRKGAAVTKKASETK